MLAKTTSKIILSGGRCIHILSLTKDETQAACPPPPHVTAAKTLPFHIHNLEGHQCETHPGRIRIRPDQMALIKLMYLPLKNDYQRQITSTLQQRQ